MSNSNPGISEQLCDHCGLPCNLEKINDLINNQAHVFCCRGCQGAYRIITDAGLQDFYNRRDWQQAGVPENVFSNRYTENYLQNFIVNSASGAEIILLIEGIRCATCVWLIEKILMGIEGITSARLNYATHRLKIIFDNDKLSASDILTKLCQIGYLARPYTSDAAQQIAEKNRKTLLIRFGTAAFLSMQLMGYSFSLYAGYFQGIAPTTRQLIQVLAALVTTPVVFYSGFPFLTGAYLSIKNRQPNMDLLVSLGALTAYFYSLYAITQGEEVYFDTSAMIITLILIGRILESSARQRAASSVDRLLNLAPDIAFRLLADGQTEQIASRELVPGDHILVRPGDRFPVDGKIFSGQTEVDESIVSGESSPVLREKGMEIMAGSLNTLKSIEFEVTSSASESFLARVTAMVENAQSRKAPIQSMADQVSVFFVPLVILIASITFLYWFLFCTNSPAAMMNAVAVLVVACPCALGLATPTAVMVATGTAATRGIIFRGGDVLEALAGVNIAAFDKTGTITKGCPEVIEIRPFKCSDEDLLKTAAKLSGCSSHPISQGIMRESQRRKMKTLPIKTDAVPGQGIIFCQGSENILAGSRELLKNYNIVLPDVPESQMTEVHVAAQGEYKGTIYLEDSVRTDGKEAMLALKNLGLKILMLTGDHELCARNIAGNVEIDYFSKMTPDQKHDWVTEQISMGNKVLMVGDGLNDAPALSAATVGCAMAGGSDIAMETSSLTLTRPDLKNIVLAVEIARKSMRIIKQNLFWAFFYNLLMLPLAAIGYLSPIYAALAMAMSSTCVILNSLRLKKLDHA